MTPTTSTTPCLEKRSAVPERADNFVDRRLGQPPSGRNRQINTAALLADDPIPRFGPEAEPSPPFGLSRQTGSERKLATKRQRRRLHYPALSSPSARADLPPAIHKVPITHRFLRQ